MQAGDYHSIVGGPGAAYWISKQPGVAPWNDRASGSDLVLLAVNESLSLDFFSFHVIAPCIDSPGCDVQDVRAQPWQSYLAENEPYAMLSVWVRPMLRLSRCADPVPGFCPVHARGGMSNGQGAAAAWLASCESQGSRHAAVVTTCDLIHTLELQREVQS